MRKLIFLSIFFILATIGGLLLFSCEPLESGVGIIKVTNNSTNVRIVYISVERANTIVMETWPNILPGGSAPVSVESGFYTLYLEDNYGDGWVTKISHTVRKDETTEIRFPSDFNGSN
jgi:hypothetical protein